LGVASRNDPELVADALARPDLVIAPDALYPVEANWGPKSDSIRRILEVWNVAPDAVVFVDDDPLARDEAAAALPGLLTLSPPQNEDDLWAFLVALRAAFGKAEVSPEDTLRLDSIRSAQALRSAHETAGGEGEFLAQIGGTVEFGTGPVHAARALELINKTNQFNLNGRRLTEADVARSTERGAELVTVSYADRYGPLGVIAAVLVSARDPGLHVDTWAMSCRAFARRIEHHTLSHLFNRYAAPEVALAFQPTARNTAVGDFLASLMGHAPGGPLRLSRTRFEEHAPPLVHRVVVAEP
jgi:FkbH-like protein